MRQPQCSYLVQLQLINKANSASTCELQARVGVGVHPVVMLPVRQGLRSLCNAARFSLLRQCGLCCNVEVTAEHAGNLRAGRY